MEDEFSPEQINQIARVARAWAPGFTEDQLQLLVNAQPRLADSGFCEAAWGMVRLEQEKGISCTEVLDAFEQLLSDKGRLEADVVSLEEKLALCQKENQQAEERYHQVREATEQARSELQAVQAERQRQKKGLAAFMKKAEKEKERIEEELEEYRQGANVTKEETATAGQLKAEVGKHGFSLDLALGLSQEFKGYENIRDKLAEGLKVGLTLTKYNEEAAEQKEILQSDIKGLTGECQQLGSNLSQLQANVAFEEKVRQFYHRYQSAGVVMEFLASWKDIFFVRCGNPTYAATSVLDRSIRGARFWTENPPIRRCPCCDYPGAFYDEELYQALNWKVGDSFQLKLGE
jgi:hypothetical protein